MSVIQTKLNSAASDSGHARHVWPTPVRWAHWLTALLIALAVAAVLSHELIEERALHKLAMDVHKQAGVLVLLFSGFRVLFRLTTPRPQTAPAGLVGKASAAAHGLIYLILFSLPALGWALVNARGGAVNLLGVTLPTLLARDRDVAETLEQVHETVGWVLVGLVVFHVLAAIWHHRVKKDRVLLAMLGVNA